MLETCEERVKLLKAGINGKVIEKAYLTVNNIKMINGNILYNIKSDNDNEL